MNKAYAVIGGAGPDFAIRSGCTVINVIALNPEQAEEMRRALAAPVIPAWELGLMKDDLYNGQNWTRNVGGVQAELPIDEPNADIDEALRILRGEVP